MLALRMTINAFSLLTFWLCIEFYRAKSLGYDCIAISYESYSWISDRIRGGDYIQYSAAVMESALEHTQESPLSSCN